MCSSNGKNLTFKCVFWVESTSQWSEYGCSHQFITGNGKFYHACVCNHTTNFALLMVIYDKFI